MPPPRPIFLIHSDWQIKVNISDQERQLASCNLTILLCSFSYALSLSLSLSLFDALVNWRSHARTYARTHTHKHTHTVVKSGDQKYKGTWKEAEEGVLY